jgi:carbon storage regulator CsrA
MLVLSRKRQESVVIGGVDGFHRLLKVTVLGVHGTNVKLGFEVDTDIPVHRLEVWEQIQSGGQRTMPESSAGGANEELSGEDGGGPPDTTPREDLCREMPTR